MRAVPRIGQQLFRAGMTLDIALVEGAAEISTDTGIDASRGESSARKARREHSGLEELAALTQDTRHTQRPYRMTILETLQLYNLGTSVVKVEVEGLEIYLDSSVSGQTFVAKVYDPVGYDGYNASQNLNLARRGINAEAAAYKKLENLWGTDLPRFFGLYDFSVPFGSDGKRVIQMLLLEYVPGTPMHKLEAGHLSSRQRMQIMKRVIEMETHMALKGVYHQDLAPRNIMVNMSATAKRVLNVKMLDLTATTSYERRADDETSNHPLYRWREHGQHAESAKCWASLGQVSLHLEPKHGQTPAQYIAVMPLQQRRRWYREEGYKDAENTPNILLWVDWDWTPWLEQTFETFEGCGSFTEEQKNCWRELNW